MLSIDLLIIYYFSSVLKLARTNNIDNNSTDTVNSGDKPYNGQIRKANDGERTELLQINFDNEWLPICTSHMSNVSADSACRQIGYTGSSQPPISSK